MVSLQYKYRVLAREEMPIVGHISRASGSAVQIVRGWNIGKVQ